MRRCVLLSLLLLFLTSPACFDEKPLKASEQLLKQLGQVGFSLSPHPVKIIKVKTFAGYKDSGCYRVSHHITTLFVCLHDFDNGRHALEAGTNLTENKWPPGRYWAGAVRGRTLVLVDAKLQDKPVADKLLGIFRHFQPDD